MVSVGDCLTSLFAGMVIFAIIGYLAFELEQDIDHVVTDGMLAIKIYFSLQ